MKGIIFYGISTFHGSGFGGNLIASVNYDSGSSAYPPSTMFGRCFHPDQPLPLTHRHQDHLFRSKALHFWYTSRPEFQWYRPDKPSIS